MRGLNTSTARIGATPPARARVSTTTAQRVVAAAIVPMVAVTVWLAVTSEHLQRPVASALWWSYLTAAPMAIGLYWWLRRPASRFGPLLVTFGVLAWIVSWESSDWPLAFDIAWLAEAPTVWLTFYLFLAFPMGRLEPASARWLTGALAIALVAFYLPTALSSSQLYGGGPLLRCVNRCPENLLQLGSAPSLQEVAEAGLYCCLAIAPAVLIVLVLRLRTASRPQRRALMPVAVTSLLFLPPFFVVNSSALVLKLDRATYDAMAWSLVVARVLLPLGFLIALLQAERFAARALKALLQRLGARPTPEQWRAVLASTLDDAPLRLAYYDPDSGRFREPDGEELTRPPEGSGRAWVPVERDDRAVAALVIDETLAEDPELVGAAASATLLAVENGHLEGELQASRAQILEAADTERRRIERDLHESTQQRLVSLRISLTRAAEQLDRTEDRATFERLGGEVDDAIDEVRTVVRRGRLPQRQRTRPGGAAHSPPRFHRQSQRPLAELPFELAEVKLASPSARPGTVAKADAIARLCASTLPFAAVVAPAGYGKTTLLAKWAEADRRPFAWVSLDGRDDDALVFLRYIAAAIHLVEPIPPEALEGLSGPARSLWSTRVPRVGSALAGLDRPLVLVLDDLHAVSNPSCLDVLAALSEYVPAGSQIAIVSREEPALPLAQWRARGAVQEIGVADLRLDDREAKLLLEAAGVKLDGSEVSALTERTEGWPAGLYLAALSMQAGGSSAASAQAFAGDDRFVSEYFRLELLSRLPEAEARFLKYTSVLDRMSGGLCDAVLETTRSADTLEALERRNGFVVPLDRRGDRYRYHQLFGQLLRNELERSEPDVVPELNRRAMAWCIVNDLPEAAVVYGHAAGETESVARLVNALGLTLYYDGRRETVEEWLGWFGDEDLVRYPALAVLGAWLRALTGRPADAERLLSLAEGATPALPDSEASATIEPMIATLRANMMVGGVETALADAELALDQLPPESDWIPVALLARAVAQALLGATDRAADDLTGVIDQGLALGAFQDVFVARAQLALLAIRQGAWGEAAERAQAAQALVDEAGLGDYAASSIAHVATARVALHEARHEDARAALTRAHRLRPMLDHGIPWLSVQVGLELTRAHLALADPSAARTVLTETEEVLELRPDLGFLGEDARELHERVAATTGSSGAWAMSLTGAELRLLPFLATHLMFPEIASRLFISRNTVKSEAVSIYRKLGVSSRSGAIERAVEVGLLDSSVYPPTADLIPQG
jgi:LuxR family transcriptional regulator, maltose regulon positive regulatory protein